MKQLLLYSLFSLFVLISFGQDTHQFFISQLKDADEQFSYGNYHLALPIYMGLFTIDSSNSYVNFHVGVCLYNVREDKTEAVPYFEQSRKAFVDAYYYLGILYRMQEDYYYSRQCFLYYQNSIKEKQFKYNAIDHELQKTSVAEDFMASPKNVVIKNLGKNVNSPYADYAPFISPEGDVLYFTSRRAGASENEKDPLGYFYEDIYNCSKKQKEWGNTQNLAQPFNTKLNDACLGFSKDGKIMYLFRTEPDLVGGDIYFSILKNNQWSEPQKFTARLNENGYNESSLTISPDEKTIYFSSNRIGGYGGKDLYRIVKLPNKEWSLPQNLGAAINTPYNEDAPFIASDGVTLFFSSQGHLNMGGYDIFTTKKLADNQWSEPENMGYPINSVRNDIFFVLSTDGTKGYFSSNRKDGLGGMDIYSMEMSEYKPKFILLKGVVSTNDPEFSYLPATITVIDYQTKELQGIYRTTKNNGKYILVLLPKKHYKIIVESDNYYSYTGDIDLNDKIRISDLFKNISLKIRSK
ncbi:MAG: PD40 domain-containing protein [Bacteroidales bacterium]|nr:PD40 domain-containing protein [Bacteroidales bacterium]